MATVNYLCIKQAHGKPMTMHEQMYTATGFGIQGDASYSGFSPRQVLVIRDEDRIKFGLPKGYLRENISVSGMSPEELRPGKLLKFAQGLQIFLVFNCEPCKTIADLVPRLSEIQGRRGILGIIINGAAVAVGESVESIHGDMFHSLSDEPAERVLEVIRRIPIGRVIDYPSLLIAAGLQGPYFRVMPKYIERARRADLPGHRVVDSSLSVPAVNATHQVTLARELNLDDWPQVGQQTHLFDGIERKLTVPREIVWAPLAIELAKGAPSC